MLHRRGLLSRRFCSFTYHVLSEIKGTYQLLQSAILRALNKAQAVPLIAVGYEAPLLLIRFLRAMREVIDHILGRLPGAHLRYPGAEAGRDIPEPVNAQLLLVASLPSEGLVAEHLVAFRL